MVNRDKTKIRRTNEPSELTRSNASFNPASAERHSARPAKKDRTANDDIIASLSNAYENKRARQVFEWELLRRGSVGHA